MPTSPPLTARALPTGWPLTPAQTRIALLLARGLSVRAVARTIGCSYYTVCIHVRVMGNVLAGETAPVARIRAFVHAVAAHEAAHPGTPLPAGMWRRGAA